MRIKQILEVENNQLLINLPEEFKNKKKVWVTIDDVIESKSSKMEQMKAASIDPLYLSDIEEVSNDFAFN